MDDAVIRTERAANAIDPVMRAIRADQLDLLTPDEGWDLRALVEHLLGGMHNWAARIDNRPPERDTAVLDQTGDDVPAAWEQARAVLFAAITPDGAFDREIDTPAGRRGSARFLAAILPIELMLHGWDAARAIGASTDIDPELAEETLALGRVLMDGRPRPAGGAFADEKPAPDGATAADRLAAFYGRTV